MSDALLKWAESQVYFQDGYAGKNYPAFVCHIMNLLDPRVRECDRACEWAAPYGWVPEVGCEKHD